MPPPDNTTGPRRGTRGQQETRLTSVTSIIPHPDVLARLLDLRWHHGYFTRAEFEHETGLDYDQLTAAEPSNYFLPRPVLAEHVRQLAWAWWENVARFDLRRARRERAA